MGHPKIENQTPYHFEPIFVQDEVMRPLFVGLVKATFRIQPEELGPVIPMRDQIAPVLEGEYYGDPENSSQKYEPECSPYKLNTDIVLIGTARAPQPGVTKFDCGFRVGQNMRIAKIIGDRSWYRQVSGMAISEPEVVEEVPLTYENAFGGTDTSLELEHGHPFEERNPVGKGYHHKKGEWVEGSPLPNIEDPEDLINSYYDTPSPIGFGFTSPHWLPRRILAGTYDEAWTDNRSPLLPEDFNPLFHNAASHGLMANGFLAGNEPVQILNASKWPKLVFQLPGITPPTIILKTKQQQEISLQTVLDTVVVNTDEMLLSLHYRCRQVLNKGPHDVKSLLVYSVGEESLEPLRAV